MIDVSSVLVSKPEIFQPIEKSLTCIRHAQYLNIKGTIFFKKGNETIEQLFYAVLVGVGFSQEEVEGWQVFLGMMGYGLWVMVDGLWLMVDGLWFMGLFG